MGIQAATDATFETLVLRNPRPVLVDFWAAWAGPSKQLSVEIEHLAARYEGRIDVVTVDVDANEALAEAFGIKSVPTVGFFQPGLQPQGVVGYRPAAELEAALGLARYLAPSPEPAAAPVAAPSSTLDEIRRLGALRDRGELTEAEFAALKARLLGGP